MAGTEKISDILEPVAGFVAKRQGFSADIQLKQMGGRARRHAMRSGHQLGFIGQPLRAVAQCLRAIESERGHRFRKRVKR
ncbi:hypothetical protein C0Z18_30255 [Trinickia dabaoshanensis]|uniref:Uncharacterized protein n=1 Tax=Trinickia dabaoshanensis TaxID=564714 RepID=A0A2N7VC80_9BURK|nr:hypothetical protein C0Z18_30255 [Trinickia dabaoshanensis]